MDDKQISTIEYYDIHADKFIEGTINADMRSLVDNFLSYIEPGGLILDAGCGSGRDIRTFTERGYKVDAFDASKEMCRRASAFSGIDVQHKSFADFDDVGRYDGIWASASLLHVERVNLPTILQSLCEGLVDGGVLYLSFKYGDSDRVKDGRLFVDMNENTLIELINTTSLELVNCFVTTDVRTDRCDEKWINAVVRK